MGKSIIYIYIILVLYILVYNIIEIKYKSVNIQKCDIYIIFNTQNTIKTFSSLKFINLSEDKSAVNFLCCTLLTWIKCAVHLVKTIAFKVIDFYHIKS